MNAVKKEDFIKILSSLTNKQINTLIKEKGKKPKMIVPAVIVKSN